MRTSSRTWTPSPTSPATPGAAGAHQGRRGGRVRSQRGVSAAIRETLECRRMWESSHRRPTATRSPSPRTRTWTTRTDRWTWGATWTAWRATRPPTASLATTCPDLECLSLDLRSAASTWTRSSFTSRSPRCWCTRTGCFHHREDQDQPAGIVVEWALRTETTLRRRRGWACSWGCRWTWPTCFGHSSTPACQPRWENILLTKCREDWGSCRIVTRTGDCRLLLARTLGLAWLGRRWTLASRALLPSEAASTPSTLQSRRNTRLEASSKLTLAMA